MSAEAVCRGGTRRRVVAAGAAFGAGVLAAACGVALPGSQQQASVMAEHATISYLFWDTPGGVDRTKARVADFEAQQPGAKIDLMVFSYDEYVKNMQVMFASDTPPDTVQLDLPLIQQYAKMGVYIDLLTPLKGDRDLKLADFPPALLEMCSGAKDNALVALPGGAGAPNMFYYNRALLDEKGIPSPYAIFKDGKWTWDTFLEAARATTRIAPSGEWQIAGCVPGLVRVWLATNGGAEFDDFRAPTKCLYDVPEAIDALAYLSELYTRYQVSPVNVNQGLGANDINSFAAGKITLNARWTAPISQYRQQVSFPWGLVPYPKGRGSKAKLAHDIGSGGIAIAKRTRAPNLSWTWAKFTTDEKRQLLDAKQSGGTGMPLSKAAQDAIVQELRTIPALETPEMTVELIRKGNSVVRLTSVNQMEINAIINEEINKLWRGESSAPVAAREAASRVNRFVKDNPQ